MRTGAVYARLIGKRGFMRQLGEYRVYLTREHEYHVEKHVCLAVRGRSNGEWLDAHWAVGQHLASAFADGHGRLFSICPPCVGERLCFRFAGTEHETSTVLAIEQPLHEFDGSRGLPDRRQRRLAPRRATA
jgi:hypothetical protein